MTKPGPGVAYVTFESVFCLNLSFNAVLEKIGYDIRYLVMVENMNKHLKYFSQYIVPTNCSYNLNV